MERTVRGAADMRLAAGDLELAAGPGGDPDFPTLIEVEYAGDALERVRIVGKGNRAAVQFKRNRGGIARPGPCPAEHVNRGGRAAGGRKFEPSARRPHRV